MPMVSIQPPMLQAVPVRQHVQPKPVVKQQTVSAQVNRPAPEDIPSPVEMSRLKAMPKPIQPAVLDFRPNPVKKQ
jgi:hypothetical protein